MEESELTAETVRNRTLRGKRSKAEEEAKEHRAKAKAEEAAYQALYDEEWDSRIAGIEAGIRDAADSGENRYTELWADHDPWLRLGYAICEHFEKAGFITSIDHKTGHDGDTGHWESHVLWIRW